MQDDRAEGRAAHARIGDAYHVLYALARELARNRQVAGFRHAWGALGSGVLQHQDVIGCDVEIIPIDALGEILQ